MSNLNTLDAPVSLGPLQLRNRWAMAPMVTLFPEIADRPTSHHIEFYVDRARRGVGLVIVGATYVSPEGKGFPNQMGIDDDGKLPAFSRLADGIQRYAPAIAQLFHAGPKTSTQVSGHEVVAPSAAAARSGRYDAARALSAHDIERLVERFEAAAWRAWRAGFAGVELHGANGYLIHAFSDPRANGRSDQWRASELLPTLIVRRVRQRLPRRFLVGYTLSPFSVDGQDRADRRSLGSFVDLANALTQAGVDYLHIYRGKAEQAPRPCAFSGLLRRHGITVPLVEGIGIRTAPEAEFFLQRGASLVAVGRALLGRPDLLARSGREYSQANLSELSTSAGLRQAFADEYARRTHRTPAGGGPAVEIDRALLSRGRSRYR